MNELLRDRSGRSTALRFGGVVGSDFTGSASDSGWYRLMPDGTTATRPSGTTDQLTLTNKRSDIEGINLTGWYLYLADTRTAYEIISDDGQTVTVYGDFPDSVPSMGVRYIVYPRFVNALNLSYDAGSSGRIEIAYSTDFLAPGITGYSREVISGATASPTLKTFSRLNPRELVAIKSSVVRDLFYQFTQPDDANRFYWGEHRVRGRTTGDGGTSTGGGTLTLDGVVASLDAADGSVGLQVRLDGDTGSDSWEFVGSDRQHVRVQADLSIPGATSGNSIAVTLPVGVASGAAGNDWGLTITERTLGRSAVARQEAYVDMFASATQFLRIQFNEGYQSGAAGNAWGLSYSQVSGGGITTHASITAASQRVNIQVISTATLEDVRAQFALRLPTQVTATLHGTNAGAQVIGTRSETQVRGSQSLNANSNIGFHSGRDAVTAIPETPLAVAVDSTDKELQLTVHSTEDTLTEIAAAINAASGMSGSASVSPGASTSLLDSRYFGASIPASLTGFSGGLNIEPLAVTIDSTAQEVQLQYESTVDTLDDIVAVIDAETALSSRLYLGATGTSLPAAPPVRSDFEDEILLSGPDVNSFIIDEAEEGNTDPFDASKIPFNQMPLNTLLSLLGVTQANLNNMVVNASLSGDTITLNQRDGTTIVIPLSTAVFVLAADVSFASNVYALTPTPAITGYSVGERFRFVAEANNTGAVSINVSGQGAIPLRKNDGSEFAADELPAGRLIEVTYLPALGSGPTALPARFVGDVDLVTSTMADGVISGLSLSGTTLTATTTMGASIMVNLATLQGGATYLTDTQVGGTGNAITLTPTDAITSYVDGAQFLFVTGRDANTGPVTVRISGLASRQVHMSNENAMAAGDLPANRLTLITYDSTNLRFRADIDPQITGAAIQSILDTHFGNTDWRTLDGVVTGFTLNGTVLTAARSVGADLTVDLATVAGAPTEAEIYAHLKTIVEEGYGVDVDFDDAENSMTIDVPSVPIWVPSTRRGGTADAVTITPDPAVTSYRAGLRYILVTGGSANTGAVTLAVSGLATREVRKSDGTAFAAGELPAGRLVVLTYDSGRTRFVADIDPQITGAMIVSLLDAHLGGTDWREQLTADEILALLGVMADDLRDMFVDVSLMGRMLTLVRQDNTTETVSLDTGVYVLASGVGGTANAITLTPTPAVAGYVNGDRYYFEVETDNTGAVTVNVSGQGAQSLRKRDGSELAAGELQAGHLVEITYLPAGGSLPTRFVADIDPPLTATVVVALLDAHFTNENWRTQRPALSGSDVLSLLSVTQAHLDDMVVNASVSGNTLILNQRDGGSISLPISTARFIPAANVAYASNVYTLTPSPAITGYAAGQRFRLVTEGANTGDVTVNVNGQGSVPLLKMDGTQFGSGQLPDQRLVEITYLPAVGTGPTALPARFVGDIDLLSSTMADGVINSLTIAGTTLTARTSVGGNVTVDLASLRQGKEFIPAASVGGTGNVITLAASPSLAAYAAGVRFAFFIETANTGAVTLNVDGQGAVPLVQANGRAFGGGELQPSHYIEVAYDAANSRFRSDYLTSADVVMVPADGVSNSVSGSRDLITLAPSPRVPVQYSGLQIGFLVEVANTQPVSINIGRGGVPLVYPDGSQLDAGDLQPNTFVQATYRAADLGGTAAEGYYVQYVSSVGSIIGGTGVTVSRTGRAVTVNVDRPVPAFALENAREALSVNAAGDDLEWSAAAIPFAFSVVGTWTKTGTDPPGTGQYYDEQTRIKIDYENSVGDDAEALVRQIAVGNLLIFGIDLSNVFAVDTVAFDSERAEIVGYWVKGNDATILDGVNNVLIRRTDHESRIRNFLAESDRGLQPPVEIWSAPAGSPFDGVLGFNHDGDSDNNDQDLIDGERFSDYRYILVDYANGSSVAEHVLEWVNVQLWRGFSAFGASHSYSMLGEGGGNFHWLAMRYVDETSFRLTAGNVVTIKRMWGVL